MDFPSVFEVWGKCTVQWNAKSWLRSYLGLVGRCKRRRNFLCSNSVSCVCKIDRYVRIGGELPSNIPGGRYQRERSCFGRNVPFHLNWFIEIELGEGLHFSQVHRPSRCRRCKPIRRTEHHHFPTAQISTASGHLLHWTQFSPNDSNPISSDGRTDRNRGQGHRWYLAVCTRRAENQQTCNHFMRLRFHLPAPQMFHVNLASKEVSGWMLLSTASDILHQKRL